MKYVHAFVFSVILTVFFMHFPDTCGHLEEESIGESKTLALWAEFERLRIIKVSDDAQWSSLTSFYVSNCLDVYAFLSSHSPYESEGELKEHLSCVRGILRTIDDIFYNIDNSDVVCMRRIMMFLEEKLLAELYKKTTGYISAESEQLVEIMLL